MKEDCSRSGEHTERLHERCVFAVAALGLSLSQLLGQNNPSPEAEWVPSPTVLLNKLVDEHSLDPKLKDEFKEFLAYYDAIRHFGLTLTGARHQKVADLDFGRTEECFRIGLRIWREILIAYGQDPDNDIGPFRPDRYPPDDDEHFIDDEAAF